MEIYRKLGLPGACGSMDATHISLGKAPSSVRQECIGKEGYPTLSWMVCVDHNRRVTYCANAVYLMTHATLYHDNMSLLDHTSAVCNPFVKNDTCLTDLTKETNLFELKEYLVLKIEISTKLA